MTLNLKSRTVTQIFCVKIVKILIKIYFDSNSKIKLIRFIHFREVILMIESECRQVHCRELQKKSKVEL